MKHLRILVVIGFITAINNVVAAQTSNDGWVNLFDGKSFNHWQASENEETWRIENGAMVCHGPRSHLFYTGDAEPFVDFELKCDVMTTPGSNAGIYFHTRYQQEGWPRYGYESQVNVTHKDPKKTGSLYGVVDVSDPPCKDNEWWTQHIIVKGKHVTTKINGQTVVDYTEPDKTESFSDRFERRLGSGTFALQGHDPQSKVYFKNIRVKRLTERDHEPVVSAEQAGPDDSSWNLNQRRDRVRRFRLFRIRR